jgi:DNA replication protein DnaC
MNTETLDKMKRMKFLGMVRAFKTSLENDGINHYTTDEMIDFLIQSEWDERHNRNILRTVTNARFRYKATMEALHYEYNRNLDKNQILRYADCSFIRKNENILVTGSTGIGKSYLASALGHQACLSGFHVLYANITKLFAKLKMAKADGSYVKEMTRIERQQLLILDDFGLQPLDNQNRQTLMEIIEDRHGKSSTIVTSQLPVKQWHEVIGEKTIADAILDRIVHTAHRIELKGESLRKNLNDNNEKSNENNHNLN